MFNDDHTTPACDAYDTNIYSCGQVSEHKVVIACLPEGQMGTNVSCSFDVRGLALGRRPPARRARALRARALAWAGNTQG
jgi:hypothetical protein